MLPLVFILFSVVSAATPSYKECTQCEYAQEPRPFTNDVDIITDKSFDLSCVAAQYTTFNYCLKKACIRNEDNARNGFLHYPCERWIPHQCPHCGEHGTCVNVTKKMYSNGYCTEGLQGPIDIRNTGKLAECEDGGNRQFFVVNKDRTECYEMRDMTHCDRGGAHWVKDHNYDSYVQTHTCVCEKGWSGSECKENDDCCAEYSVQCLACHAGMEPWEFCSNLLNVAPYNPQQAQELGCAKILESRAGITGLQYKHLSFVCNGPSDDASATWKVDGETCADYARKIKDTDIWRCSASGHIDFSNHALPTPDDVCCACGYKIPHPAIDCIGQWTDKGVEGEDCGIYIVTQAAEGEGTKCPIVAGTTITCSVQSQDCKGVWTKVGPQGDQCGKFIITQPVVGSGQPCLSDNGAGRNCLAGENCRLNGGEIVKDTWSGLDSADNYCNTCTCNDGVLLCTLMACTGDRPCTLTGGETVPPAWSGHDTGLNYCNTCQCNDGNLLCTLMACKPKCPIPGCIAPPAGCVYVDSPELDEMLCPKYPCGKLHCEEDHDAEISRMYMTRDREVVSLYYEGAPDEGIIGVVVATAYATVEDIPLDSRDIVAKASLHRAEGQESFNLMLAGGPFFGVMWNKDGREISSRVLFDKFDAKFLVDHCPKVGAADRQFPWHDALSTAGGASNTCDDYAKNENGDWKCDLAIAGFDNDRDTSTAANTCCVCDYSGRLYAEWAHDAGETPWSCDIQCPLIPHFHTIQQTFYYMIGSTSTCETVHMRSCGGRTVWSPCASSAPCRYKPKTPSTVETSMIYIAQRIFEQDLKGFSDKQWRHIWGMEKNITDNQDMLHHLSIMHDKIDRIKELEKELNAIMVPVHIHGNIVYNENSDWLGKLVDKAREDLLYRDLSTYPKLIQRLHEISNMIQHGEQNVAKEIRHAMRYDLTVLIEDVNQMEGDQDIVNKNIGNRTTSLELTVDEIQDAIWAVEQSQIGLSAMVKLELTYIRKELDKAGSDREQVFARLGELTLIAAHYEHELYKNAVNDTNHAKAIDALENEVALIKFIHNVDMTTINKQIYYIKENMEDTNWKIDSHIESVAWAIDRMRKDINNFEENVVARLQIMEQGYAQSELQIGHAMSFLDNKMNGIYDAILNKATNDQLALLEEALYASEIELMQYAVMMANETRDRTERMIDDMRWLMMEKFNELGEVPTVSEIDGMIQLSYNQGLAAAKAYSDEISLSIFSISQDAATWVGNLTLHAAQMYADEQAMIARAEAATFAESLVMNATDALHVFIEAEHHAFTTSSDVRDIVINSLFPIFEYNITSKVEELMENERRIMFLTLEQRAAELEQYAQTAAEAAAMQAKMAATNEAVAMVENLRQEMVTINSSMWNEFGVIHSELPTIKQTLAHLNGQINILNGMITKVEQDIVHTNTNVDDTNKELALLRLKLNEIIKSLDDFKSDVQKDYVSKENWDASQVLFEAWKATKEEAYQQSLSRFEQIESTMNSLDLQTTALFVSQDQKILFLQQELNSLRGMLGDSNVVITAIQGELSVLNKIQEDYPSVDLHNQLIEIRTKIDTAAQDIISDRQELQYHLNNITDIRGLIDSLGGDLDEQRADLLSLENQVMGGVVSGNLTALISNLQNQINNKATIDQLLAATEEINFQKQQLEQLAEKIDTIQLGNGSTGVDLVTAERLTTLELNVAALQNSSFGCGSGELNIDCGPMINNIFEAMANMTFNMTTNDARVDEILAAMSGLNGDMAGFIAEVLAVLDSGGGGGSVSPVVIADIQSRLVELVTFDSQLELNHKNYVIESRAALRELSKQLDNLMTISSFSSEQIEELQHTVTYIASEIDVLPIMQNSIDYLFGVYHGLENATFYLIRENKKAIDVLNASVARILPTLDVLGQEAEILRLELKGEVAQIRSEFLDLPDSQLIMDYIETINEKLANVSMEVLWVSQKQSHYEFQKNRLDMMRSDLDQLAAMTADLYNMTINSSQNLVINASDLPNNLNQTLAPLIRRIEIMESVINAHKEMNFSKQIMSLHSVIEHHTEQIHSLLSKADHSVELTESQLSELAERIGALEPSQEVLHIRDELDRLLLLEQTFPLINMSTEIHQLSHRISVFETLLPPETLEAILEDIATLKQQIQDNPNTGQILMIQTEIAQLVAATETHAGRLEDLDAINQLMLEHSDDRDVQIAEIYVELDTLENAIQTVINGHVNDMGIPNIIQDLRDEEQHTRDMITALSAKVDELKETLRYYETCLHTHDCHPGQRCNKHSECLWNEASVVCAWEKLNCGTKCHHNGHCRMLKHVWENEFESSCPASNCSDYILNDDDLTLVLNGASIVNLTLGVDMEWHDPGARCTDDMWKYDVEVSVYPPFRTNVVDTYTFTYTCGHRITEQRLVKVSYPECDLSYWLDCPDGTKSWERPDRGCSLECDPAHICKKPRYAGPGCKCSPILDGCRDFYGDVEATWDGTNCGCKCNGKLLLNNHCV
jgi:hypothetical protein